jgi:hypothetical protein
MDTSDLKEFQEISGLEINEIFEAHMVIKYGSKFLETKVPSKGEKLAEQYYKDKDEDN